MENELRDKEFIRNRITELRKLKKVSEHRMSLDLGRSKSYIQSIRMGKALPSMDSFIAICSYLGVTPKEFFDEEIEYPKTVSRIINMLPRMEVEELEMVAELVERLGERVA